MRKIATKVLKKLKKAKANKIIELGEYRKQKKEVESLFDQVKTHYMQSILMLKISYPY